MEMKCLNSLFVSVLVLSLGNADVVPLVSAGVLPLSDSMPPVLTMRFFLACDLLNNG